MIVQVSFLNISDLGMQMINLDIPVDLSLLKNPGDLAVHLFETMYDMGYTKTSCLNLKYLTEVES